MEASAHRQVIGVDLGGTAIKLGRFDGEGRRLATLDVPTPQPQLPGAVAVAIAEAIDAIDPNGVAEAVGIGLPGPTDAPGRLARIAINLPGWREVPLADWLEPRLGRPVVLANDGNCALVGELWLGAARGAEDVVLLTLGTGVGGGVALGGRLFRGRRGAAAEPGLIGVDPQGGASCNSGNRGSLESFCSLAGLARLTDRDPRELVRAAEIGEPEALALWRLYGERLGQGLTSLIYLFTPELVLLGGGLSAACPFFLPAAQVEIEQRVLAVSREGLTIRPAALGNGAGALGAARLALDRIAATGVDRLG